MRKDEYEDPLDHLIMSFTAEQQRLWDMYKAGKKVRIQYCEFMSMNEVVDHATKTLRRLR